MGTCEAERSVVIPGFVEVSGADDGGQIGTDAAPIALICRSQASFEAKVLVDLVTHRELRGSSKTAIRLIVCQEVETKIYSIAQATAPPCKPVCAPSVIAGRRHQFGVQPDSKSQFGMPRRNGSWTAKGGKRRR